MNYRSIPIALIIVSLFFITSFAADIHENAGKSGLAFLKIGVGARAAGMGEAYTAIANDATGTYWNPAGLSFMNGVDINFMHNEYFQDVKQEFLSAAMNDGKHAFGVNATFLTVGDIERREMTGESIGTFSAYDWAFSLSYANRLMENLSMGITGKLLYEKIHFYEASGYAVDFGLIYKPYLIYPLDGLQFGLAVQNLGNKMKFEDDEFDLPLMFKGGLAYETPLTFLENSNATISVDGILPNDNNFRINSGLELNLMQMVLLRGGYKFNHDTSDLSAGLGFMIQNYKVDYAYVPYSDDLGNTHKLSLGVSF